ncbi:hypothetical protein BH24ACI5_BH24ACI5_10300 [soil metagenome]
MLIALLAFALIGVAPAQEKSSDDLKPPRRGDDVVVKGCLSGGTVESTEVSGRDKDDKETRYIEFITLRLTGDKKVLEEIRMKHSGHADVLKGELRSDLPRPGAGRAIGNSRIKIGAGRGMSPESPPPLPVLQVSSFEHTGIRCR